MSRLSQLGLDFLQGLVGLFLNIGLEEVDLFNILVVLEGHQSLHVISLESQQLLVFVVVDDKHSIFLLLDLLLEEHIECSGLHECEPQVDWKNNIHDVYLLDDDAVWVEFGLQLSDHRCGELSLDISYSGNLDLLQEISDLLVTLLREHFLKSVWSEVVEEPLDVLLFSIWASSNMEVDTQVNIDSHIILGRNLSDWTSESDGVFGHNDCYSSVAAVATSETWLHDSLINTTTLLKNMNTRWNV